jgi:hypothetical protein
MEDKFKTVREDFMRIWKGDENREEDFNIIDEQGHAFFVQIFPRLSYINPKISNYQSRFVRTREEAELQVEYHKKVMCRATWRILKIDRHRITLLE